MMRKDSMIAVSSFDDVQKIVAGLQYYCNDEEYHLSSAKTTLEKGKGHCVEGAFVAAYLMEQLGYPPLLLDFWAVPHARHLVYLFENAGKHSTFGKSRYSSLENRTFFYFYDLIRSYNHAFEELDRKVLSVSKIDLRECRCDWKGSDGDIASQFADFLLENSTSKTEVWTSICRVP